MWFRTDAQLDKMVRDRWGTDRWSGMEIDFPRPKTPSAARRCAKGIVAEAKRVKGPVIVGLSRDHGGGSCGIRVLWADGSEGVDSLIKAIQFPQYKYDVGSSTWSNSRANNFDMALSLCKWGGDRPNPIPGAGT